MPDGVTNLGYRSSSYVSQNPSESSTTLYSLKTLNFSNKITDIKNSFYGANAITINFAGTEAEFQTLADNSKFTDSSNNVIEWDTGSNSPKVVCSDGNYEG